MNPRYIRWQAALGRGDLHPGGSEASARLAEWVEPWRGGLLVEIGAGAGMNASRYAARGWEVVATEPDPALCALCAGRGLATHAVGAADLLPTFGHGSVSVFVAESVLFALDLPTVLPGLVQTLAPGGVLAFSEMVWTERADAMQARAVHDASMAAFGIPVASRERWTWAEWQDMLERAGLRLQASQRLADGSGMTRSLHGPRQWAQVLRHPRSAWSLWRARRAPVPRVPDDWLESWCAMAVKGV